MIFYFSATGNSKYAAERIARECHDQVQSITHFHDIVHLKEGEVLGFVVPTYFWQLPVIVEEFLSSLTVEAEGEPYVFLTATCGVTPGCCGEEAKRLLAARNITLDASFSIKMPDNCTPFFDLSSPQKTAQINRQAEPLINAVIEHIQAREKGSHTEKKTPYILTGITYALYNRARQTKNFYVEDTCIGCGLCASKCPVNAIKIADGHPVWVEKQCTLCLSCLHHCPQFAIQYGNGSTKRHGQYRNPNTVI